MSVTVHQILNDAKNLVGRLRQHETEADAIISQSYTLFQNVEAMKEYNEDVSDQNLVNKLCSRPLFTFPNAQENKHIRELELENRELRAMLEEHQTVIELVMSKYRQKVTQLISMSITKENNIYLHRTEELQQMADNICEMADVMKKAIRMGDESSVSSREKLTALITENKGLREMVDISRTYGSLHNRLNTPETVDKEIQTDDT